MVIDENSIIGLINRSELTSRFPFFNNQISRRPCCGQPATVVPNFEYIKAHLIAMAPEKKEEFKRILGISSYSVFQRKGNTVEELKF